MPSIRITCVALSLSLAFLAACDRNPPSAAPAAAVPAPAPAPGHAGTVNVCNWSDYIGKDTLNAFEAKTGLQVDYCTYANNDALLERLKASPRAYDVVFPTATPYARDLVADGRLAELDKRLLPNLSHLDPAILAELAESDPGNAHLIPYMWGTTGLGVNVDRVRAALGPSAPLDSWGLLFNPANAAKLSKCGIGVLESSLDSVPPALFWKGMDPRDFSDGANDTVHAIYDAIRPHIRKFENGNDLIAGLANGNYCLVLTYSGDVRQARARAAEQAAKTGGKAPDIRYVIPREGAIRWIDTIAIPKDAPHPEAALRFMNYLMEPAVIASISDEVAYANANAAATPLVDKAIAGDPGIYPPAAVRAKLANAGRPDEAQAKARARVWDLIVYGSL